MRVCIPVESCLGLESRVYGHFGSAPCFALADAGSRSVEALADLRGGRLRETSLDGSCSRPGCH